MNKRKQAIIIGAGPAGLTAAYELLEKTDTIPIIIEKSSMVGGISRTENYKGNRIDIGGHRFFSKSDKVIRWWFDLMPPEQTMEFGTSITYHGAHKNVDPYVQTGSGAPNERMLVRRRKSRIYYQGKLLNYPLTIDFSTLSQLGLVSVARIFFGYACARAFPKKQERNLEDFFINRFGHYLYVMFFKTYTEKVWGVSCKELSAEWGRQRIKGLSIQRALVHAWRQMLGARAGSGAVETSLIEQFFYPPLGPGQLWELVARKIQEKGGMIIFNTDCSRIVYGTDTVTALETVDTITGEKRCLSGDYFFSTMPIKELIEKMDGSLPVAVREVARGLSYRDFITIGILLKRMRIGKDRSGKIADNWLYIQDSSVRVGRIQIFNNWSPELVADPANMWIGLEYFSSRGDGFWEKTDSELIQCAIEELVLLDMIERDDVLDSTILRVENAYPAYTGSYSKFDEVRTFLDSFKNLFLIGRNGMHKYNNQDHSMLTAMTAVENIITGRSDNSNIWDINTEQDYHESSTRES